MEPNLAKRTLVAFSKNTPEMKDYKVMQCPIVLFVLLATGCAAGDHRRSAPGAELVVEKPSAVESSVVRGDSSRDLGGGVPKHVAFVTNQFGISLLTLEREVRIRVFEKDPEDGKYHRWNATAQTAYDVLSIRSRHGNEFYIYGVMPDGSEILERWDLSPWRPGAYRTERLASLEPIGVGIRPSVTKLRFTGPWVDPDLRTAPVLTRTALAMPEGLDEVVQIEVDPEGRFLLLLTRDAQGDSTLVQLDLSTNSLTTLATPISQPTLGAVDRVGFADSTELGRLIVLINDDFTEIYLRDELNDGVFESSFIVPMGEEQLRILPPFTTTWSP